MAAGYLVSGGGGDPTLPGRVTTLEAAIDTKANLGEDGLLDVTLVPPMPGVTLLDEATGQTARLTYDSASGRLQKVTTA